MARITEAVVHALVTAPGKPTHVAPSAKDLFSALVGDVLTTGTPGAVVDPSGIVSAGKPAAGDGTSLTEPHQPAQKTDAAAAALLAALPSTDRAATPIVPPAPSTQPDAKAALATSPAATLLGVDKPDSKASVDQPKTGESDTATSNAANPTLQAQTPVAVVVPVVVDGPKVAPDKSPTDLLDGSTRQGQDSVTPVKVDVSPLDALGHTSVNPPLGGGPSSDVASASQTDAASKVDQAASAVIAATAANQSAAQSVISNNPVSGAAQPKSTPAANGKPATGGAPDAKAAGAPSPQPSDGSGKDEKSGDGAVADTVKAAPDPKPEAAVKGTSQQSNAAPSNDASTQPSALLNQVPTVTPVQAQLAAVRATSDAAVPIDGLAVEIAARAKSGKTRFDIRLDPPELGRIDVRLDIDSNGKVASHLVVDKPETLDLLRRDAPQLQQALNDSGFKTGDGGMQFSLRDQSFTGRNDQGNDNQRATPIMISDEDTVPAVVAGRSYRMAGSASGIDITI